MTSPIEHVIVLMLENRSFDHLLAYSGIPALQGVDTSKTNPGKSGEPVPMSNDTPDRLNFDPGHEFEDVDWQIYGMLPGTAARPILMNGFADKDWPQAMQCAKPTLIPVFTHLAANFLLCDNWFSSMPGPTWPNRFFVHAGSSGGLANSPSSLRSIGPVLWSKLGFTFENGTIFDALTKGGRTWRVYHGDHFPQVCAIDTMPSVFVASADKFRKVGEFAADAASGDMANYTFIEPDYSILSSFRNGDSQHPSGTLSAGEQLIATVANAVMGSDKIWESSLLVILYDEHGGFYDQVPTPIGITPPGDTPLNAGKEENPPTPAFGFDRYGIRVPAVVVSPWVAPGVSHVAYDHASLVRTVFRIFDLPGHLTARDGTAASLDPLIEKSLQVAASVPLPTPPTPTAEADAAPPDNGQPPHSLNGFARIAAQVHHALRAHQAAPGLPPPSLHAAIEAADPDLDYLVADGLPKTEDPDEARAYIQHVADLIEVHRQQQRAGMSP
jgi:phospholipase C